MGFKIKKQMKSGDGYNIILTNNRIIRAQKVKKKDLDDFLIMIERDILFGETNNDLQPNGLSDGHSD
jgi:hypothetical protein